jgi:peptidoglycan/xylan/chitin deacetylase (PgdA/CDA1 family)
MTTSERAARPRLSLRIPGVPILMYHGLTAPGQRAGAGREARYWMAGVAFGRQLGLIAREGFRVWPLGALWSPADVSVAGPSPVAITFDDGRASDYEVAYPTLSDAGVTAEFFVNTATIGQAGYLTWARIAEMHRGGLHFQSHAHEHVILLGLPPKALDRQLRDSKRLLEDRLGTAVEFLAAPYGLLDGRVIGAALEAGYRAVCNSLEWTARPGARTINRVVVYGTTREREFLWLLRGNPRPFARRLLRAAVAYGPKRLLLRLRSPRMGARAVETGA